MDMLSVSKTLETFKVLVPSDLLVISLGSSTREYIERLEMLLYTTSLFHVGDIIQYVGKKRGREDKIINPLSLLLAAASCPGISFSHP
jgi:hypothetical protein